MPVTIPLQVRMLLYLTHFWTLYLFTSLRNPQTLAPLPRVHRSTLSPLSCGCLSNCTSSISPGASYGLKYWLVALTLRITHSKTHNPTIYHLPSPFHFTVYLK